ncbi:hypothetical protein [Nocardia sp. NBC_00403]|uniref:hypothetical protein n=1 Tax=Nocardia sp. NBC_00403 TaxID=2975990 RepID=UPI002E22F1CF
MIHTILREDGAPNDGPVDRVFYEGTLPIPSPEGDQDWSNGRIGVRVLDHTSAVVYLLVGAVLPTVRQASLTLAPKITNAPLKPAGEAILSHIGPECGQHSFEMLWEEDTYLVTAAVEHAGFDTPVLQFEVNGVRTANWVDATAGGSKAFVLKVPAVVQVPMFQKDPEIIAKTIDISYRTDHNKAYFTIPGGDGKYQLSIGVYVAEKAAAPPTDLAQARADVEVETRMYQLPPEAVAGYRECIITMMNRTKLEKFEVINPKYLTDYLRDHQFVELGPIIAELTAIAEDSPIAGEKILSAAATQLQMPLDELRSIGKELRRHV